MPTVPEELDVFHVPHNHMKKVVHDIEDQLSRTDFHNVEEYLFLLQELSKHFRDLKSHEEIEDNYILSPLLPRLDGCSKATLEHDIHSGNQLHVLMSLVDSAPQFTDELERIQYGENLKNTVISFTSDLIPHMEEEEEVYLPLLVEYYTETELKDLRETVLHLHNERMNKGMYYKSCNRVEPIKETLPTSSPSHSLSLEHLPQEVLLKVFSYLDPQDLCHLNQTHPSFSELAFDGSLWSSLHPVRWADGHWKFFSALFGTKDEITEEKISSNDATKYLLSCGNSVNASLCQMCNGDGEEMGGAFDDDDNARLTREERIMAGLLEHVLPKVGKSVEVLDLAYGKSLTSEMVFKMLSFCPNIHHLDLSHTHVTDYAFKGLLDPGGSRRLRYIDLSGCTQITDTTLLRIAWSSAPLPATPTTKSLYCNCKCGIANIDDSVVGVVKEEPELKCLILSGCYQVTDVGLSSLAIGCGLPNLQYLNLSSLPRISSSGLNKLVSACPRLKPEFLFYCDNIQNGPHPLKSNGCCNVETGYQCCQNMYKS